MRPERTRLEATFSQGGRRYLSSQWREGRASEYFDASKTSAKDKFADGLRELSAEDEDLPLPEGQGPIVYKDGIFQIDISNAGSSAPIDPALKGLIDSILG
jgi:hypothetical protein